MDEGEIGRGAYGTVNRMVHSRSGTVMAVKVHMNDMTYFSVFFSVLCTIVHMHGYLIPRVCLSVTNVNCGY